MCDLNQPVPIPNSVAVRRVRNTSLATALNGNLNREDVVCCELRTQNPDANGERHTRWKITLRDGTIRWRVGS